MANYLWYEFDVNITRILIATCILGTCMNQNTHLNFNIVASFVISKFRECV